MASYVSVLSWIFPCPHVRLLSHMTKILRTPRSVFLTPRVVDVGQIKKGNRFGKIQLLLSVVVECVQDRFPVLPEGERRSRQGQTDWQICAAGTTSMPDAGG